MSRTHDPVVELVRERIDIVDAVSRHVTLKPAGQDKFKGLCPFHTEKTPSFHVNREKQLYYCFGCQAGGDVFSFFMRMENAEFVDVLRRLADEAGIPVEQVEPSPLAAERRRKWDQLAEVAEAAAAYYEKALRSPAGRKARAYMAERGISPEVSARFRLGYAPSGWQSLTDHLRSLGISADTGIEAGLLGQGRRGVYDRFRDRLIFPITDVRGRVIAFGGRALGPDQVKYINSPESQLYTKRNHLYGLAHIAQDRSRTGKQIILVEGYTDVIGLYTAGITQVVASLGTALTPEQANLIKRFADGVIIAYDADAAGDGATLRGLDILMDEGLDVSVAVLPDGEDPDSFVKKSGPGAFARVIREAVPLYKYKILSALKGTDLSTVEGRIDGTKKVVPVLVDIDHAVAREEYVRWTAEYLDVSVQALAYEINRFSKRQRGADRGRSSQVSPINIPGPVASPVNGAPANIKRHRVQNGNSHNRTVSRAKRHKIPTGRYTNKDYAQSAYKSCGDVLAHLLHHPELASGVGNMLGNPPFIDEEQNKLFQWILVQGKEGVRGELLVDAISDSRLQAMAKSLLRAADDMVGPFEVYLHRAWHDLLKIRVVTLEAQLERLSEGEWMTTAEVNVLLTEFKSVRDRLGEITRMTQDLIE